MSDNTEAYTAITGVKVTAVNVKVGDSVKAGDVLAQFDVSTLNPQLKEYKTAYDKALKAYNDSVSATNTAKQNKANAAAQMNTVNAEIDRLEKEIKAAEDAKSQTTPDTPEYSQEQLDALIQKLKDSGFSKEEIDKIIESLKNSSGGITKRILNRLSQMQPPQRSSSLRRSSLKSRCLKHSLHFTKHSRTKPLLRFIRM